MSPVLVWLSNPGTSLLILRAAEVLMGCLILVGGFLAPASSAPLSRKAPWASLLGAAAITACLIPCITWPATSAQVGVLQWGLLWLFSAPSG